MSSGNRARDTHWRIEHADSTSDRYLDQGALKPQSGFSSANPPSSETVGEANARWHYLGTFPFRAGEPGAIILTNDGTDPTQVVIADAVRVGASESGVVEGGDNRVISRVVVDD